MNHITLLSEAILQNPRRIKTLEGIVTVLDHEFIQVTTLQMDPMIHHLRKKDYTVPLLFVKDVLQLFNEIKTFHGKGFIPKFAKITDELVFGYNCLGKAIAFGAFMRREKIHTRIAVVSDHAMCIITLEGVHYLCDPNGWKFTQLHGTFIHKSGYTWYVADKKDRIDYFYLVIHEYENGVLDAICRSFQFLEQHQNLSLGEIQERYVTKEFGVLALLEPRFNTREIIAKLDWKAIRDYFWSDLNRYEKDFEDEWLMQALYIKRLRFVRQTEQQFDTIVFTAVKRLGFIGNVKDFHTPFIPRLRKLRTQVVPFLETGEGLYNTWPIDIQVYLTVVQKGLATSDPAVRAYGLRTIKEKLFSNQNRNNGSNAKRAQSLI